MIYDMLPWLTSPEPKPVAQPHPQCAPRGGGGSIYTSLKYNLLIIIPGSPILPHPRRKTKKFGQGTSINDTPIPTKDGVNPFAGWGGGGANGEIKTLLLILFQMGRVIIVFWG